ncbi:MAG TPA: LLM class F420-dependent oxidoreductase [Mycobacterium sp.]|nr:LLM class F420-dependent oxidoreductase [Mycobacterium sp.]
MTIRLALQIPNFSYGTPVADLFPTVLAQAREAEAAGFDAVFLMDHFYQLPMLGAHDEPMLEAYTALGALATATERVLLGTLVTGNTYRNPTLLAKIITTLDVVSAGRAVLGLGTGWFELEHEQLGFEFGTFTDRFAKLEEALKIVLPMLAGDRVSFAGDFYRTSEAVAEPRYRDHIPLMIGGSGEKKTFGLAARYFDHLNVIAAFEELPGKVDALKRRCDEAGRDPGTLETSVLLTVVPDPAFSDDLVPPAMRGRMAVGSPDRIAETIRANVVDVGIDGVVVNLPAYRPGSIAAIGEALRPVVGA